MSGLATFRRAERTSNERTHHDNEEIQTPSAIARKSAHRPKTRGKSSPHAADQATVKVHTQASKAPTDLAPSTQPHWCWRKAPEPMNCQELIAVMAQKSLWTSPAGKTPAATLYSSILKEIRTKGAQSRFQKVSRGKFAHT